MLELKDVYFTVNEEAVDGVSQKRDIISGINFTFESGGFYAITGPNGSGKTTLSKLIMGINAISSGSMVFDGEDITSLSISERAQLGIAYGFQHPARFKGITFRDLLSIALSSDDEQKHVDTLGRVGICSYSFLDKPVDSKLSGGEIKKIELATIIGRNPKLAIYDEPDTGIDLWTINPMVELLQREQKENGTTTIVISHNRAFLEAADNIMILKGGKIAFFGDFKEAIPLLTDLSICDYKDLCEGDGDARCYR